MNPPSHWRDILTRKVIINLRDEPDWLIEFIKQIQADAVLTVEEAAQRLIDTENCDGFKLIMGNRFIICGTEEQIRDFL